ncbi:MAG: aspartate kinase [Spirochaetaceae bacterium]|jgi:aspartate kinase|nr:aspartate kinase [Spirochaetaceae bacterium]
MIVMKFGGSSVANAERIRHVASIIQRYVVERPVVVLSAMGDTTDHLLEAADRAVGGVVDISRVESLHRDAAADLGISFSAVESLLADLRTLLTGISLLRELTDRTRDYLVSFGERLSVRMMAEWLTKSGLPATACDAWDVGFISDSNFTAADLLPETWEKIREKLGPYDKGEEVEIPIVTGFIAKDRNGYITTLGRGGSDLTATVIGSAMRAKEIQTWKDVDGILNADPRIVPKAKPVAVITYDEAAELAYFGAQVLHPRCMQPCLATGTPVRVKNSYNPVAPGSLILMEHIVDPLPVRAITSKSGVTLIDIVSSRMLGQYGFLEQVFHVFAKHRLSVDVIATSEVSVSLTVDSRGDIPGVVEELERIASIEVKEKRSIVTIICDVGRSSKILAYTFRALDSENINVQMISQGASKVNISFICDDSEVKRVIQLLHHAYFTEMEEEAV